MRLYYYYCPSGFSNGYLLGTDLPDEKTSIGNIVEKSRENSKEAIIIDPGMMNSSLLSIIEENDYALKGVLITHDHPHHLKGLKAIQRIYDTKIYAIKPLVGGYRTSLVSDSAIINIGAFKVEVFSVPGHSADSAVFRIERFLFTGDALSAGLTGSTASSYSAATQVSALRRKILSLPGDYTILPGHGPPSSLEAERRFNLHLNSLDQLKTRRPAIRLGF